jgi:hypothetical protein
MNKQIFQNPNHPNSETTVVPNKSGCSFYLLVVTQKSVTKFHWTVKSSQVQQTEWGYSPRQLQLPSRIWKAFIFKTEQKHVLILTKSRMRTSKLTLQRAFFGWTKAPSNRKIFNNTKMCPMYYRVLAPQEGFSQRLQVHSCQRRSRRDSCTSWSAKVRRTWYSLCPTLFAQE